MCLKQRYFYSDYLYIFIYIYEEHQGKRNVNGFMVSIFLFPSFCQIEILPTHKQSMPIGPSEDFSFTPMSVFIVCQGGFFLVTLRDHPWCFPEEQSYCWKIRCSPPGMYKPWK